MDTCKLIVNPAADKGTALAKIPLLEKHLKQYSVKYDISFTKSHGHAIEIAEQAARKGYRAVIAVGGDGTSNEVLNGIVSARRMNTSIPPFGIIPVGRGNDFAYGYNIPPDIETACGLIASGKTVRIDVGKITGGFFPDGRFFGNGVGIGFDATVGFEAAKMKRVHGFLAYVLGTCKTLARYPTAPDINIKFNGHDITRRSVQISIMNGTRMGGAFFMAPQAVNHDGKFDLVVTDNVKRHEFLQIIFKVVKGVPWEHPKVAFYKASSFKIRALQGGMATHADGETVCINGDSLDVECLPEQIDVLAEYPRGNE